VTISKTIAAFVVSLLAIPAWAQTENLQLPAAEWREDLAFLARELPARHANAFHYTPLEHFEAAVAGLESALGGRVLKIHDTPISRAAELALPLASQDENPPLAQAFVEDALTTSAILHGLGITPDRNAARYTLADDAGREFTVEVQAVPTGARVTPIRSFMQPPPLPRKSRFAILVQISSGCAHAVLQCSRHAKSVHSIKGHAGAYTAGERWLIHPIRDLASINRKGHLFVVVGAVTFSAAMNNAAQFRSHLTARYSTQYYKFSEGGENAIRPDREIAPSWADCQPGRDPVLEWVLSSDPKRLGGSQ
jgi:hypothetical protein